ncbi:MAG: A24 family peptidase [Candidatus Obscuribacterales bacterium]
MDVQYLPLHICAILVASIAVYTDVRTRKIPNKLTFPAAFLGLILSIIWYAYSSTLGLWPAIVAGALHSVLGWFAGVVPMTIIKIFLRQMGHGDTKLMAAIGAFVGPKTLFIIFLYYSFCYGLYAIFAIGKVFPWMQVLMSQEADRAGISENMPDVDFKEVTKARKQLIPVAPFIWGGTVLGLLLELPTEALLGIK